MTDHHDQRHQRLFVDHRQQCHSLPVILQYRRQTTRLYQLPHVRVGVLAAVAWPESELDPTTSSSIDNKFLGLNVASRQQCLIKC